MAFILICDNCGDRMQRGEAYEIQINAPRVEGRTPRARPRQSAEIVSGSFYFCGECAAQLHLAVKQTALERKRGASRLPV